jgi:hypothetical protein
LGKVYRVFLQDQSLAYKTNQLWYHAKLLLYFPISIILLYFLKGKCTKFENGKPSHLRITLHFPFFGTEAMLLTAAIVPYPQTFGLKPSQKTDNFYQEHYILFFIKRQKT